MEKSKYVAVFLFSAIAYILIAYFTPRTYFNQLMLLLGAAFVGYFYLLRQPLSLRQGLVLAISFRLIFILASPQLSDDYYRFIWDGTLLVNGENPYLHLPSYYLDNTFTNIPGLTPQLYQQLNSPNYFSVYPPICQYIFGIARFLAQDSIWLNCLILRLFILTAEFGTLITLRKLLHFLHLPAKQVWLYALNPLVIVELTGNLHFEALLICFLLTSLYLFLTSRYILSAVLLSLAINVKLLPLIFLPFILKQLNWKFFIVYFLFIGFVFSLMFLPFLSEELAQNIFNSINLYFQKFEFNASIYYLLRWLGYLVSGYNQIYYIGPALSFIVFLTVWFLAFRYNKKIYYLPEGFLLALTVYFLLAAVVHPWYITTLVALSALTKWRYPVVWSGMAFLSYAAYQSTTYQENLYLVALEYTVVFGIMTYEFLSNRRSEKVSSLFNPRLH